MVVNNLLIENESQSVYVNETLYCLESVLIRVAENLLTVYAYETYSLDSVLIQVAENLLVLRISFRKQDVWCHQVAVSYDFLYQIQSSVLWLS